MQSLFADGRIVDAILALMVAEAIALAIYRRRTGRGIPLRALVVNLGAGAALLLTLRAAMTGASIPVIGALLFLALVFHIADLAARWRDR